MLNIDNVCLYKFEIQNLLFCYEESIGCIPMKKTHAILLVFVLGSPFTHSLQFINFVNNNEKQNIITSFDLLILTPDKYQKHIQPLIIHKYGLNIKTTLISIRYIYDNYPGRDYQEQIKYCIKQVYDESGISLVLLIGDFKDIPVRYVHNNDGYLSTEPSFISDLYYADLYDEQGIFQTWDTDGNNIFGEWNGDTAQDYNISLSPEIAIGRLPCSNVFQVRTMIKKIIDYETSVDDSWFRKMVVAGGDTYSEARGYIGSEFDSYEGEELTQQAINIMSDFEAIRLWASTNTLSTTTLLRSINDGCGFLYLSGHGNPGIWLTHPPNSSQKIGYFPNTFISLLRNNHKLPIAIDGGCLNCRFDVRPLRILHDPFTYHTWHNKCWGWALTSLPYGGSIATIGNTHLSWMDIEFGGGGSNWLELQFFREYANGTLILGNIWKNAITSYVETFPINWDTLSGNTSSIDVKTVQQWTLIGDPTLQIKVIK